MLEHVWVLVIEYEGGEEITVHASRTSAWQELFNYVEENWAEMFGLEDEEDTPIVITKKHVERYFDESRNGGAGRGEWYALEQKQVLGEKEYEG